MNFVALLTDIQPFASEVDSYPQIHNVIESSLTLITLVVVNHASCEFAFYLGKLILSLIAHLFVSVFCGKHDAVLPFIEEYVGFHILQEVASV